MSQTAAIADESIPVIPGTEGLLALAIGRLVAQLHGGSIPAAYQTVDLAEVASASGVSDRPRRLAGSFRQRPVRWQSQVARPLGPVMACKPGGHPDPERPDEQPRSARRRAADPVPTGQC